MINTQKLFIELEGPRLMALRYIYAPEYIDDGFRVGLGINKYGSNCMTLEFKSDKYVIKFYKNGRPKYNRSTGLFDPPTQKLIHTQKLNTLTEVKKYLYEILESRYASF